MVGVRGIVARGFGFRHAQDHIHVTPEASSLRPRTFKAPGRKTKAGPSDKEGRNWRK